MLHRPTLIAFLGLCLLSACGPTIYYLGDTYQPIQSHLEIDRFYDVGDIKYDYKVIGQMTHDRIVNYPPEMIQKAMLEEAKRRGADGILFERMELAYSEESEGDRLVVTAKLLKYL